MSDKNRRPKVELTLDKDRFDRGLDAAGRRLRKFARDGAADVDRLDRSTSGMMADVSRRLGRGAMRTAGRGVGALGIAAAGAGLGVGLLFDDVSRLEKGLARYQNATESSDQDMGRFRESLSAMSRESGLSRQELLDGAAAYVALTGDAAGAAGAMGLFAKVGNATGATMQDVAATAAAMKDNLKIDPKDFEAAFAALHVQGKAGAVELRELATELAGVAPSFAAFAGGTGAGGLAEMGAALQVARKGFGSTSEAATGLRALMVSIQRNADKFGKAGVKVFDRDPKTGKKTLREFSTIIDAIGASRLAKDPTLLTKAFGSDEAKRTYDQLVNNRALLDDLIVKSKDKSAIDRDAAKYLSSPAAKMAKAWEEVKLKLAEAFSPERIEAFAGALLKVVAAASQVVDGVEALWSKMAGTEQDIFSAKRRGMIAGMSAATGDRMPAVPSLGSFELGPGVFDLDKMAAFMFSAQRTASGALSAESGGPTLQNAADTRPQAVMVQNHLTLQVDGSTLARVQANSPVHRLSPGGR